MSSPRDKQPILKVVGDMPFVVYGYEPSTGYHWFRSAHGLEHHAIEKAEETVDDATRAEGWVYRRDAASYVPIGYASLSGDGGTEYTPL